MTTLRAQGTADNTLQPLERDREARPPDETNRSVVMIGQVRGEV